VAINNLNKSSNICFDGFKTNNPLLKYPFNSIDGGVSSDSGLIGPFVYPQLDGILYYIYIVNCFAGNLVKAPLYVINYLKG
jgi:hypothetical protein